MTYKFKYFHFLFPIISTFLISCGGGGAGGGSSSNTSGTCKDGNSSAYCTTEFHANYGLKNIKAYEAYDDGYFGGVNVAVMDGGFDTDHNDINFQNVEYDDVENDSNADSACPNCSGIGSHGTHVAGIIGAKRNSSGMHGVAPAATIVPIRIFNDSGNSVSDISESINFAGQHARIVNNSWGTSKYTNLATCTIGGISYTCRGVIPGSSSSGMDSSAEITQWNQLASTDNTVAVFAAGNDGANSETGQIAFYNYYGGAYIGSYDSTTVENAGLINATDLSSHEARYPLINSNIANNWINVVSVDSNNVISSFSNGCGDTANFCIAAPGEDIYSTIANNSYATKSGTSMAAPHVSGALAILKKKWPNLTSAQLVDIILENATDLGAGGTDSVYGMGLLNLKKSMDASGTLEITYASDDGTLKKYLVSNTLISSNNLMKNLDTDIPIGVVDKYDRVYSVKLNNLHSLKDRQESLYIYERNLTNQNRYISSNDGKFYFNNVNHDGYNEKFDAKERIYNYDLLSFESLVLNSQKNLHLPIGSALTLSSDTNELKNYILKSNYYFNKNRYSLDIDMGIISESDSVLGSSFTGAFSVDKTNTYFAKFKNTYNYGIDKFKFNFGYGMTTVDFNDSNIINMSNIHTFESILAYEKIFDRSKFSSSLELPLYISNGSVKFNNVSGYNSEGRYQNGMNTIDLSPEQLNGSLNLYYDLNIDESSNFGIHYHVDVLNSSKTELVYNKAF